jgi:hypothetical protein
MSGEILVDVGRAIYPSAPRCDYTAAFNARR